jgi:bifunctional DNA-binding transcriptional regulator/antitoxin component of YhaV-PrlF toxin-antitoxin module
LDLGKETKRMKTLTVTERGQVTFRKDVLQHLGISPGEKIEWEKQPDGAITLRAARPLGTIDSFLGLLARRTRKIATLDEMNEAAAAGWSTLK